MVLNGYEMVNPHITIFIIYHSKENLILSFMDIDTAGTFWANTVLLIMQPALSPLGS